MISLKPEGRLIILGNMGQNADVYNKLISLFANVLLPGFAKIGAVSKQGDFLRTAGTWMTTSIFRK